MGRRSKSVRREPNFDVGVPNRELRADSRDRLAGTDNDERRVTKGARKRTRAANPAPEKPQPRTAEKKGRRRSVFGRMVYWSAVLALWGVIAGIALVAWVGAHLPAIQSLEVPKRPPSIQIAGTDGRILAVRGDSGVSAKVKDLPRYVAQAFIAIEDRRFHSHFGVDPIGIARAAIANLLRRGVSQGGSTLTQQLAKNLFLTQDRTFTRKLQELVLALWLERKFTKDEILELYLNRVYFGAGAYGVEAAAQRYFGKHARDMNLQEAAMLAGLVRSPSRLAPTRNPNGAERRAQVVISAMADAGFISDKAAKVAIAQPAHALKQKTTGSINYVADWIMDVLDDMVGRVEDDIVVETSIDPALQLLAEQALSEELAMRGGKFGVEQGAIVAMSPDGAIRAMIGGRDYSESQFNRAVAAKRQPGSAFKPFVYLTALERGLTPETVREDKPIVIKGWRPENYTREYYGPVTLTQALAMSLNTVAVRLALEFGPTAVMRTAHRLGIASKLEPNASLALGTSEVSVLEMASAFATFANNGMAIAPHVVESVRGKDGKVRYQRRPQSLGQVIEPRYVAMMNVMMQETLLTGTGRKADLAGRPAAGKTGTSQDFRDGWFVGYTAQLVTAVWLGNDDSSPTKKMTGGGLPSEIWARFMKNAHRNVPVASLPGVHGGIALPYPGSQTQSYGQGAPIPPGSIEKPVPPGSIPGRATPASATRNDGMDSWLLDRLLGRR
ncbi:penicillin-binding protein 1A [Pseudorhodoplanes sp.]|uniref:transglycosylase domain-containing protein n=1 Tax=Pseudorhodoplanes sp. TaxID=1934341 RepID=UPI002C2825AC|nr:penicillin-binding protein 1A [Pseudorhodoplanes sp.]HWV53689.1 penicillin-binding protein 1A [Pseudorhodoplanes sp.]